MVRQGIDHIEYFFLKQNTAYEMRISDWSSDVCSSDLVATSSIREKPASLRFMFGSLPKGFQDAHVPSPAKSGLGDGMGRKNPWETSLVGRGYAPDVARVNEGARVNGEDQEPSGM